MEQLTVVNGIVALGCFAYVVGFGAGLYEVVTVMPQWFTDPPRSFKKIRERSSQVQGFWIPAQIATFVLLAAGIILQLNRAPEPYLVTAGVCYLAALVSTVAYFLKRVTYFMSQAADSEMQPRLRAQGLRWYRLSLLRTLALAVGSIAYIVAVLSA